MGTFLEPRKGRNASGKEWLPALKTHLIGKDALKAQSAKCERREGRKKRAEEEEEEEEGKRGRDIQGPVFFSSAFSRFGAVFFLSATVCFGFSPFRSLPQ